ncbi:MAG: type IX secretion system membrane protein PorP/SprF [Flavobacteriales bacterium]|nr:type IX secretion system membrane protein PorP/SprF [Flavobacteriales bacterium]
MRSTIYIAIAIIGFSLAFSKVNAQQLPQYSLYMFNPYIVNPAYAGVSNEVQIRSTNKYQWTGITDAPRTFNLSFTNTAFEDKAGYGGIVYTDVAGPTRRIGAQMSGAYHAQISESLKISLGLSLGFTQYAVDGDKISIREGDDPILQTRLSSDLVFDGKAAFYLYHEKYFFGLSVPNITQTKLEPFDDLGSIGNLDPHYNVLAGYNYELNEDITLKPSVLLKYVEPIPFRIDMNLTALYQDRFWIGAGYRLNDGIIALAGADLNNRMQITYGYDILNSDLSSYSGGVHELTLGLNFTKPEAKSKDAESIEEN